MSADEIVLAEREAAREPGVTRALKVPYPLVPGLSLQANGTSGSRDHSGINPLPKCRADLARDPGGFPNPVADNRLTDSS
jgi:hypothetical protein